MNKRILKLIHSLIGLSVLAMFTIAIVAGQARANSQSEAPLEADLPLSASAKVTLSLEYVQDFEVLPIIVETVLDLPVNLTLKIK